MAGKVDSSTHAAAIARVGESAAKHELELLSHLDEIVKGTAFRGSHRSQDFLKHIVEQALHGNGADLRERSIGVALFGRQASYDTADDAIVRVTASDVRKRLLQHYGESGGESRIRISLRSGSYIPEFSFLAGRPPVSEPGTNGEPTVEVSAPAEPAATAEPRTSRSRIVASVAVAIAVIAISWWALARGILESKAHESLILTAFQGTPRGAQVVVADDALVLIQVLLDRRFTLEEYENLTYLNVPDVVQKKELQRFWGSLSTRQITNVGDLQNAHRIAHDLQAHGWDATIRVARQMHARSFRTGNFVVLGSSFSNPWADLFPVDDTNFPLEELPRPGKPEIILNRHPRDGEPARFEAYLDPRTGKKITFCRVSVLENAAHSGRVILVAGQSMSATEMSGEFLLHDDATALVRQMLNLPDKAPLPDMEMMLRVSEQNEIGDSVNLVACRKVTRRSE